LSGKTLDELVHARSLLSYNVKYSPVRHSQAKFFVLFGIMKE